MATSTPAPLFPSRPWLLPLVDEHGVPLDQDTNRAAWAQARLGGLGGSDIAAVVGENPNKSAIDVFLERVDEHGGPLSVVDENDGAIVMGHELEPLVLDLYAKGGSRWPRSGGPLTVYKPPTMYHRDRPWQRASADGIAWDHGVLDVVGACSAASCGLLDPRGVRPQDLRVALSVEPDHGVEVKTHQWFAARAIYERKDNGVPIDVPPDKRIQCAWYMALYGIKRWRLVALVDTSHRRTYDVPHDQAVEDYLLEEAETFWRKHVIANVPPSSDGSNSFGEYLKRKFDTNRPELTQSTAEIDELAGELWTLRIEEVGRAKRIEAIKQKIQEHIGDAAGVNTAHGPITWKYNARANVDNAAVIEHLAALAGLSDAELKELKEQFRRDKPSRPFLVPRKWTT